MRYCARPCRWFVLQDTACGLCTCQSAGVVPSASRTNLPSARRRRASEARCLVADQRVHRIEQAEPGHRAWRMTPPLCRFHRQRADRRVEECLRLSRTCSGGNDQVIRSSCRRSFECIGLVPVRRVNTDAGPNPPNSVSRSLTGCGIFRRAESRLRRRKTASPQRKAAGQSQPASRSRRWRSSMSARSLMWYWASR